MIDDKHPRCLTGEPKSLTSDDVEIIELPSVYVIQASAPGSTPVGEPDLACSPFFNCCCCFATRFADNNMLHYKRIGNYVYTNNGKEFVGFYDSTTNSIHPHTSKSRSPDITYCCPCMMCLLCWDLQLCWTQTRKIAKCKTHAEHVQDQSTNSVPSNMSTMQSVNALCSSSEQSTKM